MVHVTSETDDLQNSQLGSEKPKRQRTPEQIIGQDRLHQLLFEGFVIVPLEPTPAAVGAWYQTKNGWHFPDDPPPSDTSDYAAYRALVWAASGLQS